MKNPIFFKKRRKKFINNVLNMKEVIGRDQTRKWMVFIACIWIQAFTGTNFDFSSYSSELKSILRISQVELNYLSMASDMGKAFGWCSGVCLLYLPLEVVLVIAAFMGFIGYGSQWLLVQGLISLPYSLVFLQCLLAGTSISWFNTVSYVLCIRNFPTNKPLALSLSICFNSVSANLYNNIVNSISPNNSTLYLLLNALIPLITSLISLIPILNQPQILSHDNVRLDSFLFHLITILASCVGVYLLLINSSVLVEGFIFLLVFPLMVIITIYLWDQESGESSCIPLKQIGFDSITTDEKFSRNYRVLNGTLIMKDKLEVLEEEHSVGLLVKRRDFWLYYVAYLCGGTIGIVYSNNLGQIAQSLGFGSEISSFVSLYSACSFFGRLLSSAPDLLHNKGSYPRTGWLAYALIPTPIAFISLISSSTKTALKTATALIGLGSGFVFSTSVSITSELFGPNSAGINHNLLITNIPIGSFFYGLLAALLYESNMEENTKTRVVLMDDGSYVCMGRECYSETFLWWGFISLVGVVCGFFLFFRTKHVYDCLRR